MPTLPAFLLTCTATTAALMAGLFYAYSCSVSPGLGRLSDSAYLEAMQAINRAILNPVFFISFLGTPLLLPLSTWLHYHQPPTLRFWLLLLASIVYLTGVFGVTMFGNVPLNDALDSFHTQTASLEEISIQRSQFEVPWNRLNTIRTMASLLSCVLTILACLSPKAA